MRFSVVVPFHRGRDQLSRCLSALAGAVDALPAPCEVIVAADGSPEDISAVAATYRARIVRLATARGPAAARNHAAAAAAGDIIVFVDSDVVVHADSLCAIARSFETFPDVDGVFGAYDDRPVDEGLVSQARNLAHAFVHRSSNAEATTFWAGLGAVRAAAFRGVGGFDERFGRPSVEDIELGYRLVSAGHRIRLDPTIRGTHLKRWTLGGALLSDLRDRGIPWTRLLHRHGRFTNDLNLAYRYRAAVVLAVVGVATLGLAWVTPWALAVAGGAFLAGTALDRPYLAFVAERRSWWFAARAIPWRIAHHLVSAAAFVVGTVVHLTFDAPVEVRRRRAGLSALLLVSALLAGHGLRDDTIAAVGSDEVRYAMNGVFLRDALADGVLLSPSHAFDYARRYYARYPALSLGFHPPLLPLAEVPSFSLFGISLASARLVSVLFFLGAVLGITCLMSRLSGPLAGWLAGALFATNPLLLRFGRHALSEMPALALMIGSVVLLHRFCRSQRRADLVLFVALAAASVYAKQLAALLFPVEAAYVVLVLGPRRAARRDVALAALALVILTVPIIPMTLRLSAANVAWVTTQAATVGTAVSGEVSPARWVAPVGEALGAQFSIATGLLAVLGLAVAVRRQHADGLLLVLWLLAAAASVLLLTREVEPLRYGIYLVPPAIGLAALGATSTEARPFRVGLMGLAAVALVVQTSSALQLSTPHAPGYAAAARFVTAHPRGATILYSAEVDSGLFVFHVRRHDPERRAIVLRADKLLTTSALTRLLDDRIQSRAEVLPVLRRFGVGYVVLEDRATSSAALNWLRDETRSPRFAERLRVPVGTADARLQDTSLVVYEYLDATVPDPGATIDLPLPVVRSRVVVPLSTLLDGRSRQ